MLRSLLVSLLLSAPLGVGAQDVVESAPPAEDPPAEEAPPTDVTSDGTPIEETPVADVPAAEPVVVAPALPPPPAPVERVAVLLVPTGDVDPGTTDALTELLISEVAEHGVSGIVGKEELQALLGRDDAGILACVESGVCLGQVSVELGVREVVAGTLGVRGGTWIFALARIDARTGETRARVFREVEGDLSALIGSLASSVPELYVDPVRPGRLVLEVRDGRGGGALEGAEVFLDGALLGVTEGGPFRDELVVPGAHTLEIRARGHATLTREIDVDEGATLVLDATLVRVERGLEISPLTWAPGAAGIVALAIATGLGVASQATPDASATMREVFDFYGAREREAVAADVLFVVGGLALGLAAVSLALDLTNGESDDAAASLSIGPGGLAVRATLP